MRLDTEIAPVARDVAIGVVVSQGRGAEQGAVGDAPFAETNDPGSKRVGVSGGSSEIVVKDVGCGGHINADGGGSRVTEAIIRHVRETVHARDAVARGVTEAAVGVEGQSAACRGANEAG